MRIREHFYDKGDKQEDTQTNDESTTSRIYDTIEAWEWNTIWMPPPNRDRWLDEYIEEVRGDIVKGVKTSDGSNMDKEEGKALKALINDDSIV